MGLRAASKQDNQIGDKLMTPCDICGVKIDTDIHAEEMGLCVECSTEWWAHSDDGHECSWGCISSLPEKIRNDRKKIKGGV